MRGWIQGGHQRVRWAAVSVVSAAETSRLERHSCTYNHTHTGKHTHTQSTAAPLLTAPPHTHTCFSHSTPPHTHTPLPPLLSTHGCPQSTAPRSLARRSPGR